jgi:alpha-glucosidase
MIASVYRANVTGRMVYCPEEMKCLHFREGELSKELIFPNGVHYVTTDLDEVTVFVRKGGVLPLSKGRECVEGIDFEDLELLHFAEVGATYAYYTDDGMEKNTVLEEHWRELRVE